uniref:NADH-plastoquinone oxidoreductase subunit I n=1 Tax=Zygophyllum kansuense TaxID=1729104 RepID=UPI001FAEE0DB|nr:NADH-plastoquinone oxidoreductase subunit I [Zygophyllum kansuense]UJH21915.1 NADH-plastoquinone oxidoreductase subunit I [Zygophyllum kansuense]
MLMKNESHRNVFVIEFILNLINVLYAFVYVLLISPLLIGNLKPIFENSKKKIT